MDDLLSTNPVIVTTTTEATKRHAFSLVKAPTDDARTNAFPSVAYQFDAIGGTDRIRVDAVGGADFVSFDLVAGPDALAFSTIGTMNRATIDAVGGTDAMSFDAVGGRRQR
jgi:hypothetical protein